LIIPDLPPSVPILQSNFALPQPSPSKKGRPKTTLCDEYKVKLAYSMANLHVSARSSGPTALMWLDTDIHDPKTFMGFSRPYCQDYLFEVYSRVLPWYANRLLHSSDFSIIIDGMSHSNQREFIGVCLTAFSNEGKTSFTFPIALAEKGDKKALTQLNVIKAAFKDFNALIEAYTPSNVLVKTLTVLDVCSIVFDTTSSNTGDNFGLKGLLWKARREIYEDLSRQGIGAVYRPLQTIKCEDHILNLVCSDFEGALIAMAKTNDWSELIVHKKFRATDVVQFICQRLSRAPFLKSFKGFLETYNISHFQIHRTSDTRFAWRDFSAIFVWRYLILIIIFFARFHTHLTILDKYRLVWLLHPMVIFVIKVRALFGLYILGPAMKKANQILSPEEKSSYFEWKLNEALICTTFPIDFLSDREGRLCQIGSEHMKLAKSKLFSISGYEKNFSWREKAELMDATLKELDDEICNLPPDEDEIYQTSVRLHEVFLS
jgi:hypothetical protein